MRSNLLHSVLIPNGTHGLHGRLEKVKFIYSEKATKFCCQSNNWRFGKILWPSQNIKKLHWRAGKGKI